MKKLYLLLAIILWMGHSGMAFNVTFQVDMNNVSGYMVPEVNGTFNNWCGGCFIMTDANADGIFEGTADIPAGSHQYKFAYDSWAGEETLLEGSSCTTTSFGFTNRVLVVTGDIVLPVVCWESCTTCDLVLPSYDVTFQVDMSDVSGFTTPEVNGSFNNWCGNCFTMTDANADGIWTATTTLPGGNYEFKFSYDNWTGEEALTEGSPCTVTNFGFTNRTLALNSDIVLPVVCWNSCTSCDQVLPSYDVTFQVDMSNVSGFTTPEVNGSFNAWCGNCFALTDVDADGIWQGTTTLQEGAYEYKFSYDNWAGQEALTEGSACTMTTDGFTNRTLIVDADVVLPVVCWESCSDCETIVLNQMDLPVTFELENVEYGLIGFGGAEVSEIVVDPTDANNTVAKVTKSATAQTWAGTTVTNLDEEGLLNPVPFTENATTMSVRVWSPDAGIPVRLKVEDWTDPTHSVETEATTTVAGQWETLVFDFSNEAPGTAALNLTYSLNKISIFFNFGTTGEMAGEKIYYFDDIEMGGEIVNVAYNVTFQVDMNNVTGFTTPEVNGTFNGWCGGCFVMTDENADGIWVGTAQLEAGTYEYKYAYDAWAGSEQLMQGSPCTVTNGGFTNRSLVVAGDVVLPVVCWASCNACDVLPTLYNVTFQVDMNNTTGFTTPEVNGSFNGWCGNCFQMTDDDADGIWTATTQLEAGNYEYKFAHDNWAGQEALLEGSSCTVTNFGFTNRSLAVSADMVLPIVCWGSCTTCDQVLPSYQVTFQVDMSNVSGFNTPEVNGTFNGWCGSCFTMSDADADGIWEATTTLQEGVYEYKFSHDNWSGQEELTPGSSCTITNGAFTNRLLNVNADVVLPVVCWASCEACEPIQPVAVTLQVNTNEMIVSSVEVSGSFNAFCNGCEPLTSMDNIHWTTTLMLLPGVYEFYYTADGGAITETLTDDICTVNSGGVFHRIITVTEATAIPEVCWEACVPCTVHVDEFALEHLIVYPNPARDAFTITTSSVSPAMVHVVNMMGEVVYATSTNGQNKIEIPAELWSAGIYQVQWIEGNQQWVKSIVIEK